MLRLLAERVGSRARLAFEPRVRGSSPRARGAALVDPAGRPRPGNSTRPSVFVSRVRREGEGQPVQIRAPEPRVETSGAPRSADAPPLRDAMRALVRKVHPDLFASGPAGASEVNDDSLKTIQGVLDAVTKSKSIPDAGIKRLRFYVRDESAPEGTRASSPSPSKPPAEIAATSSPGSSPSSSTPSACPPPSSGNRAIGNTARRAPRTPATAATSPRDGTFTLSPEDTRPTRERHPPPPLRRLRLHRPRPLPPGLTARGAVVR